MSRRLRAAASVVLAVTVSACNGAGAADKDAVAARKAAITFFKAIQVASPATEQAMNLQSYAMFGYPALIDGNLGRAWAVTKLEAGSEAYEVRIPFWATGKTASGENARLRRNLLVRLTADPGMPGGWAVTRFKFAGDQPLSWWHQAGLWSIAMLLAPITFFAVLYFVFLGFLWWRVAMAAAFFMSLPLRLYVSYVCFGSVAGAVFAMVIWVSFLDRGVAKARA